MFKSRVRPIVIPQYEHGRLAGTLASLWGNEDFDRPDIDFPAFVQGVALHDWGYGVIDNLPIGEMDEADWLRVAHRGVEAQFDDPVTDIIVKLHLRRLVSHRTSPERAALLDLIGGQIAGLLPQTRYSLAQFEWADKITWFCDTLAFDFSFEAPTTRTRSVYARTTSSEETPITCELAPGGEVWVDPWPFSVSVFSGIIVGYQQASFPGDLRPEVVPFYVGKRI